MVSLSVGAAWLSVVLFTPLGGAIARWAERVSPAWAFVLFVGTLVLIWEVVAFPVSLFATVQGERRFRKNRLALPALLANQARDAATGIAIVVVGAWVIRLSIQWAGPWWWLAVGALGAPLLLLMTALAGVSVRVAPGSRPLPRQALADRLSTLAHRACGRRVPVLEWSDPAAAPTALVTGVGASGAILLSREMVADWSDDEIEVVVAHELSHHARRDLWRKASLDALVLLVALGAADRMVAVVGARLGAADVASLTALPLMALTAWVMWWILRPLRLAQSRAHEREADRYAIALTGNVEAFRTAIRRMAAQHLVEERPSAFARWFFHRHPTAEERINQAR